MYIYTYIQTYTKILSTMIFIFYNKKIRNKFKIPMIG